MVSILEVIQLYMKRHSLTSLFTDPGPGLEHSQLEARTEIYDFDMAPVRDMTQSSMPIRPG